MPPGFYASAIKPVSAEFQPIGQPATITVGPHVITSAGTDDTTRFFQTKSVTGARTMTVDPTSLNIDKLDSCIYCFGIADQLYSGLKSRYTSMTLTFPTQVLNIASMSNLLKDATPKSAQTITPRFIDTIFFLFPLTSSHRTIFRNPGFDNWYLTAGGFGQYPDIPYGSRDEPRLIEMTQNAINLNGNNVSLPTDVFKSLLGEDIQQGPSIAWTSQDRGSFFLAIPLETDGTFQQGQTSATPINYELHIQQPVSAEAGNSLYSTVVDRPPLICLLQDATISIQVMADGSPSLVEVGPFDITSPVAG
jgi:hypothetical protein